MWRDGLCPLIVAGHGAAAQTRPPASCAICCQRFGRSVESVSYELVRLPDGGGCGHGFHFQCLQKLLFAAHFEHSNYRCPLCRHEYATLGEMFSPCSQATYETSWLQHLQAQQRAPCACVAPSKLLDWLHPAHAVQPWLALRRSAARLALADELRFPAPELLDIEDPRWCSATARSGLLPLVGAVVGAFRLRSFSLALSRFVLRRGRF